MGRIRDTIYGIADGNRALVAGALFHSAPNSFVLRAADRYVFLCDQAREMLTSGGVNIYPAAIESVLVTMPGGMDCAVFGIPDSELGEQVIALLQPTGADAHSLSADDITAWLRQRIAGFKVPR